MQFPHCGNFLYTHLHLKIVLISLSNIKTNGETDRYIDRHFSNNNSGIKPHELHARRSKESMAKMADTFWF